eukprot:CAMPEP_0194517892 /NCGR_PEP_ID=MMETSP0253-20130528/51182_1 /TAXON_ID=2966 /ORGANISM="Noctiluca scintillans" /LENGTH=292 /DNA_ID=CAMNT_0039361901 /DNA_START=1 /DNA_END=879 /DNA_ORIENTATION=-
MVFQEPKYLGDGDGLLSPLAPGPQGTLEGQLPSNTHGKFNSRRTFSAQSFENYTADVNHEQQGSGTETKRPDLEDLKPEEIKLMSSQQVQALRVAINQDLEDQVKLQKRRSRHVEEINRLRAEVRREGSRTAAEVGELENELEELSDDEVLHPTSSGTPSSVRRYEAPPKLNPRSPTMSAREPILDAFSWHRDYDRMKVTLMSQESKKSKSPTSTASTTSIGSSSTTSALLRLGESSHVGRGELLEELRKSTIPVGATPARHPYKDEVKLLHNLGLGCQRARGAKEAAASDT